MTSTYHDFSVGDKVRVVPQAKYRFNYEYIHETLTIVRKDDVDSTIKAASDPYNPDKYWWFDPSELRLVNDCEVSSTEFKTLENAVDFIKSLGYTVTLTK